MTDQTPVTFDSGHQAPVTAAALDHYGTRIATADASGAVSISKIEGEVAGVAATLVDIDNGLSTAHAGACWAVAWAHPKFEGVLATAGFDRTVKIWREVTFNQWKLAYLFENDTSIESLAFAPSEYGVLSLAAGVGNGKIVIISLQNNTWAVQDFAAHDSEVKALEWGPTQDPCILLAEHNDKQFTQKEEPFLAKRLASAGSDGKVKVWTQNPNSGEFEASGELSVKGLEVCHDEGVVDLSWSQNLGSQKEHIATVGEDHAVRIWTKEMGKSEGWKLVYEQTFQQEATSCSWSDVGLMLSITLGDDSTMVVQKQEDESWAPVWDLSKAGE